MRDGSYSIGGVAGFAYDLFKVGTGERPNLQLTGIPVIDTVTGGLFPGTLVIVGAEQGTGKSSILLTALLSSPHQVGAIFLEDGPDLVGSRALAAESGVNSRDIRFAHKLSKGDNIKLQAAKDALDTRDNIHLKFCLAGSMEQIEDAVGELGEVGCTVIYLDYLHKVRGVSDNRRGEIGMVMTRYQTACLAAGAVPVMLAQLSRLNPTKENPEPRYDEPMVSRLKESGDLEAEARCIVMAWPSEGDRGVNVRLSKSAFGGEGARDTYTRDASGTLRTRLVCDEWSAG